MYLCKSSYSFGEMSDSESDSEYRTDWEDSRDRMSLKLMSTDRPVVALRPSEEAFERWSRIPVETRRDAGQRLKICAFWLPILLQREPTSIAQWAEQIGVIDANDSDELTLKHLRKIETLEAIFRALERGTLKKDQSKHVVWISNMFNLRSAEVLEDALHWLERTGEPAIRRRILDLGHANIRFTALHVIFTEFAKFIQEMGTNLERTMKSLTARPSDYQVEKCEEMKKKGNDNFQKKQYEEALKFYSKAVKFYPDNHIIYGNRALCYIRCNRYLKAVGDGKRATLIKPLWAKGHYRYCEALFSLGEYKMAIEANKLARLLCKADPEGTKDLEQQHQKFIAEMPEPKVVHPKKTHSKRPDSINRAHAAVNKTDPPPQNKVSEVKVEKQPVKNAQSEGSTKNSKPSKSELSSKNGKGESSTTAKKKSKTKNPYEEEIEKVDDKSVLCKHLRSMVQDAHSALTDLRSRNAEQAFSQALVLVDTSTPKELGLSTVDVLLLLYGRASALTEIGQPEELGEAQRVLEKIKSFEERTFQCLVYYAVGRVYLKENRFAVALEQFSDSLQTVKNQITPGKLTWPLTKEVVKETQPDYFKEILESAIELCKFPPIPDAMCRLEKCLGPLKAEIYFTDPDFKGFIQICCCQKCVIEYHIACWKTLKTSCFSEKNEKDFLRESCLTPDCVGQICVIKIFGPTGLVKCKFEADITKQPTPKKPKINQACTSQKKLKSKEEHKLKRKQHKQSFQEKQAINDDILQQKEDSATQSQQKAWLLYRDRVLLQISQNMELLREEKGLHVSALIGSLKPWLELDASRGNQVAMKILNWQQEPLETLSQAVELLLERKNRVWARVLIQVLSSCLDINPKLNNWACQLNSAGLNAARSFIERYGEHLEQLDLAFLLNFGPLQDVIIEKLGTRPELFSSIGLSVTEYLKQASPHDTRLFIWTLEEHRDEYVSCHPILDEYFDMMDGHCSVLKKSDENQSNSPMKSRGRKKKQKEPKGVIVLSGMRGPTPRDEWDQDFFEDDSLSFLHPGDPFSVPSHLREQVADFEDQYNNTRHRSHYKKILDNNPDPTKESLYDYFAQILEEHGPLVAEDPLLVGELVNFPSEAQLKIQEAGGFELFLLESLRFIKMGRCIGLAKHAVSLQQAGHGACLDDLDDIDSDSPSPDLVAGHDPAFTSYVDTYSSAQTEFCPVFSSSYVFDGPIPPFGQSAGGVTPAGDDPYYRWTNGDSQQHPFISVNHWAELDLPASEGDGDLLETSSVASGASGINILMKHAAVQTCQEAMRSVAVNTEIHERFESCQGDIIKKEKTNKELEQQIKNIEKGCDHVNLKHKEDIAVLEEDVQKINANIHVTNKELALFQQKLEEEVRKDQKEKKANQEGLKSLKVEIDELVEEQGSLARSIREKKASYDAKFSDFLELSNQSAAEKMSLEDEIKRCKALLISATRRCHATQVSVVESRRDHGLYGFYRELANGKALLTKLDEAVHRFPSQDMEMTRNSWRVKVQEVEKKIATAEAHFQEQLDQVKNGRRVSELPPVAINNQPEPPAAPLHVAAKELPPPSSASHSTPPIVHPSAAEVPVAPPQHKPPTRTLEPSNNTVFDKAMERLTTMFPDYTRSDLSRFVQELRSSNGGSLGNMALQDMVGGVTQLILDHQEKLNAAKLNVMGRGSPAKCATPPLITPVWQSLGPQRATHPNALNAEDPCIICHEDMSPDDICVLVCRHSFHNECIRSWLKEQSTCPTCRDHALLSDDFPVLPDRRRPAP
ncbi:E3 ubiquitin-protein ligase TTC3-like isoform X9 [Epinephelus fuscoguttatus]|uniref:E3 ubiquitin-protein ligase TTC3-like isoform X8 n=1 Tax=Epinephelus fuscoguttatus TaxID=293821 RepID=UPI0020D1D607|nr:E3 ubiquitin-protein ligase TTC3-like isoform X8 [Epinephelus fuscoguttatus]XP_049448757.1 E3 ubiquitin-protein ligase TTC3-like isoform X9 [Epinephelus fuscoguttatus]